MAVLKFLDDPRSTVRPFASSSRTYRITPEAIVVQMDAQDDLVLKMRLTAYHSDDYHDRDGERSR